MRAALIISCTISSAVVAQRCATDKNFSPLRVQLTFTFSAAKTAAGAAASYFMSS